jgi:hypothetical protein
MEEVEHLGGRIEMEIAGFLPQRERGYPDRDKAILPEREPEVGMGDDVEREFAIAPAMDEVGGRRTAQRETAEYERPGVESEFLLAARALLANEADRFNLFESLFGDAEAWENLSYGGEGRRENGRPL